MVVDGPAGAAILLGHGDEGAGPWGVGGGDDDVLQPGVDLLLEAGFQGGLNLSDWSTDRKGLLDQLDVHLDQLGVPTGNVLVGEDRLVRAHEVTDMLPGFGGLIEDLVVIEVELLGELIPPGGDGGLDVGLPLARDVDVVEGAFSQEVSRSGLLHLLLPLLVHLAGANEHGLAHNLAVPNNQAGGAAVPEQHGEAGLSLLTLPQIVYPSYQCW